MLSTEYRKGEKYAKAFRTQLVSFKFLKSPHEFVRIIINV